MKLKYKIKRIPVELAPKLTNAEYVFLDWLIYRSNLNDYQIHISTAMNETGLSRQTIVDFCKRFKSYGVLNQGQSETNNKHKMLYCLNYDGLLQWISLKVGQASLPTLVKPVAKLVKPIPEVGQASLPTLVKPVDHTVSTSNFKANIKEIIQEVKIPEQVNSLETKPVTLKTSTNQETSPIQLPEQSDLFRQFDLLLQEKLARDKASHLNDLVRTKVNNGNGISEEEFEMAFNSGRHLR